jgi:hypothetical protein
MATNHLPSLSKLRQDDVVVSSFPPPPCNPVIRYEKGEAVHVKRSRRSQGSASFVTERLKFEPSEYSDKKLVLVRRNDWNWFIFDDSDADGVKKNLMETLGDALGFLVDEYVNEPYDEYKKSLSELNLYSKSKDYRPFLREAKILENVSQTRRRCRPFVVPEGPSAIVVHCFNSTVLETSEVVVGKRVTLEDTQGWKEGIKLYTSSEIWTNASQEWLWEGRLPDKSDKSVVVRMHITLPVGTQVTIDSAPVATQRCSVDDLSKGCPFVSIEPDVIIGAGEFTVTKIDNVLKSWSSKLPRLKGSIKVVDVHVEATAVLCLYPPENYSSAMGQDDAVLCS